MCQEEIRKIDECGMEKFGTLDNTNETIAILGDSLWPQTAKQKGEKISKRCLCNLWEKRN